MTYVHEGHGPEGNGGSIDHAAAGPHGGPGGSRGGADGDRGRRRREQTRAALLDAARRLWAERGIHGASLDDVASAAGMTKGAVYSNFAGKTDLVLALLEDCTRDLTGVEVCDELRAEAEGDAAEDPSRPSARTHARAGTGEDARMLTLLLMEFWLYGMRDYAAGWRIADWYTERREHVARGLEEADGISPTDRATLAMALDAGLAFQHLLDPEGVPAGLYSTGLRLMLGRPPA